MPHINVLDLAVFPAMSRRHNHLSRSLRGIRVLKEDEIWSGAVEVWKKLPSSTIVNSFVLAGRVVKKILLLPEILAFFQEWSGHFMLE